MITGIKLDERACNKINKKIDELLDVIMVEVGREFDKHPLDPNFPILLSQSLCLNVIGILSNNIREIGMSYMKECSKDKEMKPNKEVNVAG